MKIKYSDFVKTYSKIHRNSIYYPKVMKFHDKGLKVKNISKKLNLPYLLVWRWVNNKTIPHSYLEYSKIKKKFNSKEIKNLAKVMGYIYGDGGILKNGRIHYCNTEKFLISDFIKSVNKVFAQNPHIKKESKIFRVKFSAIMGKTLWCLFGKFSYGKDTKKVTEQIKKMPLEWKANMLQTWFNDDGSVPNYGVIAIKQKPKHLIEFIQTTLMEFNIKSIVSRDGDTWLLRICSYLDLKKFQEKINFTKGYRKRELLEKTISEKKNPTNVTKNKILELLQNSPRTLKELQYNLSINRNVIYGHLHGWKRKSKNKKSTLGLVDLNLIGVKGKGKDKIFYIK